MVKAIQKRLNWRSRKVRAAAVLCIAAAGLAAGFFGRAIAGEPVATNLYCTYDATGLTTAQVAALQALGYLVQLNPIENNTATVCVPCANGTVGCAQYPPLPPSVSSAQIVAHSGNCVTCTGTFS